jgi:hypothetical protein
MSYRFSELPLGWHIDMERDNASRHAVNHFHTGTSEEQIAGCPAGHPRRRGYGHQVLRQVRRGLRPTGSSKFTQEYCLPPVLLLSAVAVPG